MRLFLFYVFFFSGMTSLLAQSGRVVKTVSIQDTIQLEEVSISPFQFKLQTTDSVEVDSALYEINFSKAQLVPFSKLRWSHDSLLVTYVKYPEFLTKTYQALDEKLIIDTGDPVDNLYELQQKRQPSNFVPFSGLNTSGSISRALSVGNNQNAVVRSELDLQISGKISEKVMLRASIQDDNTPIQSGGYTQQLNEFDQIFIEMEAEKWRIRAGDIDLVENQSFFASYTKRVQGLLLSADLGNESRQTEVYGAAALVRGVFTRSELTALEGNQGPYKLVGENGQLYVLIVSGSEKVFVNGRLLTRGENEDYLIDYNAGEIIFNPTFPVTSEMRIVVEYQVSERNFSRIVATTGSRFKSVSLQLNGFLYNENDLKNQPLQQSLTEAQVNTLQEAGDNPDEMFAPSAVPTEYSENRILYAREFRDGQDIFVFSTDSEAELFNVRFTNVGPNQGNYLLSSQDAIARIYEYVSPVNGIPQGNFEPVVRLFAPTKLQIAMLNGLYTPSENSTIQFEVAASNADENLFSELNQGDNRGLAAQFSVNQTLYESDAEQKLDVFANLNFIEDTYTSIERLYNVEFKRDWNLFNPTGDQLFLDSGFDFRNNLLSFTQYNFQRLEYTNDFLGQKHSLTTRQVQDKFRIDAQASYLDSESSILTSEFARASVSGIYDFGKIWSGLRYTMEDNQEQTVGTKKFTANTQGFSSYEVFSGVGDSTNVYVELGFRFRQNDSLRDNVLQRVNRSANYYVRSQLVNTKASRLSLFANLRNLEFNEENRADERTLNSRIIYSQNLWNRLINLNTSYETNSGNIAQQDFTYLEVEPGQGQYTWIDYNENGIQELNEFEIAQFQDEGRYVRILLPNQIYVRTNQTRFSQQMTLNFQTWQNKKGWKKWASNFYNQTSLLLDKKLRKDGNTLHLNPFSSDEKALGENTTFRNVLFFNRGLQKYTASYNFTKNTIRNLTVLGLQESSSLLHELKFIHKFQESWLITSTQDYNSSESFSDQFENRNFNIEGFSIHPKVSYLLGDKRFDIFYELASKENQIGGLETLDQQTFGLSFILNSDQNYSITGEVNYIQNKFNGSTFSPVAYQMLEGLQPNDNFTWSFFLQKKITAFLDLNLTYFGRKSENINATHTGSVQLRAFF
ncbi:hypothetical protein [Psychroflexus sediminis]|uniref:Outer membrane protein beta-barrel family protein n=1 Tax=Psychroflexus sediminis TaxID=470826 RepID=A0A1G7XYF8_9FLAO|nr:hypothetical protein [Psychroflexus sediminis]SDG89066.1 hypothetical protein SAMN04488027_11017 [Psychroflexus sediminis]